LPVLGGVVNAGHSQVGGRARDGPARLGDPDGLPTGDGGDAVVGLEEKEGAVVDGVRVGSLVVRVLVETEEIAVRDDLRVGRVDVDIPGIDVSDGLGTQRRA